MLLIFSDLHLDNYRRFSFTSHGGVNSRLLEQVAVVQKLRKLAEESTPEAIMFLGDLFNGQGATINKQLYLMGYKLISSLAEVAPLYLLVGNHDIYGSQHILDPMSGIKGVTVVANTFAMEWSGYKIVLQPWGGMKQEGDVCLGHLDIEGARTGMGYELPGTLHKKEYKDFKLVVSGHYHSYQEIHPNIIYCGAVMPMTFGDISEEDYGALLLDTSLVHVRHIIDSPKFIPISIHSQEGIEQFCKHKANNYYRLTITDRKIVVPNFDHRVEVLWDVQEEIETRLKYEETDSLEDILKLFIDSTNTEIDKEQAKEILMEVMQEV